MTNYFIGLDSGGTKTRAFLFDEGGSEFAIGEGPGCNPAHGSADVIRGQLNQAVDLAIQSWESEHKTVFPRDRVLSMFLSSAGYSLESEKQTILSFFQIKSMEQAKRDVGMEMYVTLVGGLEGQPGISIIAGTGTACLAENAQGQLLQTGGWESLVADEGGGYYLGLQGMIAAVRMSDGRQECTNLKTAVFRALGIDCVEQIIQRLHKPLISKSEVAKLAPVVIAAAESGDMVAFDIVQRGADELALLARTSHRLMPTSPNPKVSVCGGMMKSDFYRKLVFSRILENLPTASVALPSLPPVIGAGLLALRLAGKNVAPTLLASLREQWGNKLI